MLLNTTYLEKVLDALRIVAVAFSADSFHFFDLSSLASRLNVFKVHIWVLTKVNNGPQKIKETLKKQKQWIKWHKHTPSSYLFETRSHCATLSSLLCFLRNPRGCPRLCWILLCKPGWSRTHYDTPASDSKVLRLKTCATKPGYMDIFENNKTKNYLSNQKPLLW